MWGVTMPVYLWKGKDSKKRVRKGEMEALSKKAVSAHLTKLKIVPAKINNLAYGWLGLELRGGTVFFIF